MVEPLFWGTGEILIWQIPQLFTDSDRRVLYKEFSGAQQTPSPEFDVFNCNLDLLFQEMEKNNSTDIRGFYSFFPVLPEKEAVVILDPSDFHTELLTVPFSAGYMINSRPVTEYFRPDGDLIAFSAFSTIPVYGKIEESESSASVDLSLLQLAVQKKTTGIIEKKITGEIRRALGIDNPVGISCEFDLTDTRLIIAYNDIFELLNIEDRLGTISHLAVSHQNYPAKVRFFIHHPQAG